MIGYVGQPKEHKQAPGCYVRTALPKCQIGPRTLVIDGIALRRYFYLLGDDRDRCTLYDLLRTPEESTLAELRLAWRVRSIEIGMTVKDGVARARTERAFNLLADPDLRKCYDALRRDPDAPPLFPYGGSGTILVEGQLGDDGQVFFAHHILAYKPEITAKRVSLLLRCSEFFTDRIVCRDSRRRLEVWLDGGLVPGVHWDLTWNRWKHWLKGRVEVDATFVHADKYHWRKGEWTLRPSLVALPSRLHVVLPDNLAADIEGARAIHSLLGLHADVVKEVQTFVEKEPVEHTEIQRWFDQLNVAEELKPHHVTWRPDYDSYYFDQLLKRSQTWFLFRDEYLFAMPDILISEVPQPGHATYLFARPPSLQRFMKQYSAVTREDIRHNRNNIATELGFVGRVMRGRRKTGWLADVLKHVGAKTDYAQAFD
jgi:hypothetical protein